MFASTVSKHSRPNESAQVLIAVDAEILWAIYIRKVLDNVKTHDHY